MQHHVGHPAVVMGQHRALKGLLVYKGHAAPLKVVEAVHVLGVLPKGHLVLWLVDEHHRLKELPPPVLDILAQRVQVGGEHDGDREQALLVLALALAI